nr:hypothetical protein [Ardenticatena sp.]
MPTMPTFEDELAKARHLLQADDLDDPTAVREIARQVRRLARTPEQVVRVVLLEARWLVDAGRFAEALLVLDEAQGRVYEDDVLRADVLALRARILVQQGHLLAATQTAHTALEHNPAHVEARLALAKAFMTLSQPEHAIPLYHEAIPLLDEDTERARVHLLLARAYRAAGVPVLARLHARRAVELAPLAPREHLTALWYHLSSMDRRLFWLTLIAVVLMLITGLFGRIELWLALLVVVTLLVAVASVNWLSTPSLEAHRQNGHLSEQRVQR